jgi:hypothetical protein
MRNLAIEMTNLASEISSFIPGSDILNAVKTYYPSE